MALQLRRGTNAQRLGMTPANGELIFVTDYELVSTSVTSINTSTETLTTTAAHGLSVDQQVKYIGATLNGLTADQVYFVKTAPTITTFTLSTTQGGSTLNITGTFTVALEFAKTPTTAASVPLGTGVSPLWIGDGDTVGGVIAGSLNLDDLLDVVITEPANEGEFLWYDGTNWINTNDPTIDTTAKALNLIRRSTTAAQDYETSPALILTSRVTDAVNDNTDDAGPAVRYQRSSGTQSTKTYVSGGAIAAFTVTLNNVTGLVVGNKVTGTGLPDGNGALITVIAGNQLTLDTAFTVQAAGTYTIGAPVAFGQISMEYFGTTDVHKFRVTTTTDNFLETPVDTYPGTYELIDSSKNATNINEGILYIDAVNSRVGINNTSPTVALDVTGAGRFSGVISTTDITDASSQSTGSIITSGGVGIAKNLAMGGILSVTGRIDAFSQIYAMDTTDATSQSTGSIITSGGIGVAKKLHVGGTVSVDNSNNATSTTTGSIQTDGGIGVTKDIFAGGKITTTDTTEATSQSTGSIITSGGVGIAKKLHVGGTVSVDDSTNATSATTGSIQTDGGVGIVKDLFVGGSTTITGDLTVQGTTTTINSTTLLVKDKNIEMGVVTTPTNTTADGGGIILKGTTDKTILYDNALGVWVSNIGFNTTGSTLGNVTVGVVDDNTISTTTGDLTITATGSNAVNIDSGTTEPTRITRNTSSTATAVRSLALSVQSSGTPAVGFGNSLEFEVETAPGNTERAGFISVVSTDVTPASEDFSMGFGLMTAGATADTKMTLNNAGDLAIDGDLTVTGGDITTSAATASIFNTTATTVNAFGAATDINIGVAGAGVVDILCTTQSTNQDEGALRVAGGVGIKKVLWVGGEIHIDSTADGTSATTGSLQTDGGVGIAKKLHVGGTVSVDDSTNATSTTTGSIQTDGGIGVVSDIFAGGKITTTDTTDASSQSTGSIITSGGVGIAKKLHVGGTVSVDDATAGTTSAGSIQTDGGISVTGNSYFGGNITYADIATRIVSDTTTTSTAAFTLASTTRNAMKLFVNISRGSDMHACEIIVMWASASTAQIAVYGELFTASLATFDADVSSGTVRLRATPTSATSTTFSFVRDSLN